MMLIFSGCILHKSNTKILQGRCNSICTLYNYDAFLPFITFAYLSNAYIWTIKFTYCVLLKTHYPNFYNLVHFNNWISFNKNLIFCNLNVFVLKSGRMTLDVCIEICATTKYMKY